jgi:IclR family mhp operon transcriptional activator
VGGALNTRGAVEPKGEREGSVRAVRRCLAILKAINRAQHATIKDVAAVTGIPYPTACRIAQTLADEGMIERDPTSRRYRPTALIHTLSSGNRDAFSLIDVARPLMIALTQDILWPVTLCTRVGSQMMVQFSTHHLTALALSHYAAGYTLPIDGCAAGRAYLAFCPDQERETVTAALEAGEGYEPSKSLLADLPALAAIRALGHSLEGREPNSAEPGKISAIAVPLFHADRLVGTLTVSLFTSAMPMARAVDQFAVRLRATAAEIATRL